MVIASLVIAAVLTWQRRGGGNSFADRLLNWLLLLSLGAKAFTRSSATYLPELLGRAYRLGSIVRFNTKSASPI